MTDDAAGADTLHLAQAVLRALRANVEGLAIGEPETRIEILFHLACAEVALQRLDAEAHGNKDSMLA